MSEVDTVSSNNAANDENNQHGKGKQRRAPRISTIDRAREESEAITKGLGPTIEGRRRTRSAAKGVSSPATPAPPVKKEKKTPASANSKPARGGKSKHSSSRGRPKRNVSEEADSHDESKDESNETEDNKKDDEMKDSSDKEETGNNNADATKVESESKATENGAKEDSTDAASAEQKSDDEMNKDEENSKEAAPSTEEATTDADEEKPSSE